MNAKHELCGCSGKWVVLFCSPVRQYSPKLHLFSVIRGMHVGRKHFQFTTEATVVFFTQPTASDFVIAPIYQTSRCGGLCHICIIAEKLSWHITCGAIRV
jgi:hypothetical protein